MSIIHHFPFFVTKNYIYTWAKFGVKQETVEIYIYFYIFEFLLFEVEMLRCKQGKEQVQYGCVWRLR